MPTDREALAIATRALPLESRAALHFALAVSRRETHYGDGWDFAGHGSHNWGSIIELDASRPHFSHLNNRADEKPFESMFRVYPTDEAGFKDVAFVLLKPNVREAVAAGNGTAAVAAQRDNKYFSQDLAKYTAAVEANYGDFLRATSEPRLLSFADAAQPSERASTGAGLNLVDAAVGVALLLGTAWLAENFGSAKK